MRRLAFLILTAALLSATSSAQAAADVLTRVRHNGLVRCAIDMTPGFSQITPTGDAQGFDIDFCRAIAAATLGDASRIAVQRINTANKFKAVANGEVDVAFGMATWT